MSTGLFRIQHPQTDRSGTSAPSEQRTAAVAVLRKILAGALLLMAASDGVSQVVINEIHFHPPKKRACEFVELLNAGDAPVNLSRWTLEKFEFPAGLSLRPGGFVVVATNPAEFKKEFGFDPLGPLPGKLKHGGETIRLRDAAGTTIDAVPYADAFPWPTAAAGDGSSLERVHPLLPSSSPSSWRSSGFPLRSQTSAPLVPASDPGWHWRPGTSEASEPRGAWRQPAFVEDATWKPARLSIGYGDDDDNTAVPEMQGNFTSLYLRRSFSLQGPPPADALMVRLRVDDGCILWLNGVEILRRNVPGGDLPFNATGIDHEAGTDFEFIPLADAHKHLRTGNNLLAAQVFNASKDSSDLTFDVELRPQAGAPPARTPTPMRANSVFATRTPPAVLEVRHSPERPVSGQPVKVTALAEAGAASMVLEYQTVEPGAYVRLGDPAFDSKWNALPMERDATARTQTYAATLPGDLQKHRRLIRYRIRAASADGLVSSAPREDDPCPNLAWFVYDGFPSYQGAIQPGKSPVLEFSQAFLGTLPAYHLLATKEDVEHSQWDGGYNRRRMRGTLVVDGKVYDHIYFHNRGQGSAHLSGKNKWGLRFSRHQPFEARTNDGTPYRHAWDSLNLNPGLSTPYLPVLCGAGGLDEALSFRAYQLAGVPSPHTHWVQWRVLTDAREATPGNAFSGDLWGLYLAVQDTDGAWLKELGLPDGNVYSTQSGRKHLAHRAPADQSDWNLFLDGVQKNQPEAWWRENLDLPAYYGFHAMNRLLANVDLRPEGNHNFYRRPDGHWAPVPWDLDMMFVPRHHQPGIIHATRCLDLPVLRREYQNRAREILDLFCSDPSPRGGQIGQLLSELSAYLQPAGQTRNWPELDAVHWNFHPRKNGHDLFFRKLAVGEHFGGRWERQIASTDFQGFVRYMLEFTTDSRPQKNYAPNDGNQLGYGFGYLAHEAADPSIPSAPVLSRTGPQHVSASKFLSPVRAAPRSLEWRIAAIGPLSVGKEGTSARFAYELTPLGMYRSFPAGSSGIPLNIKIPTDLIKPGNFYRVRARYEDAEKRASHWSAPLLIQVAHP